MPPVYTHPTRNFPPGSVRNQLDTSGIASASASASGTKHRVHHSHTHHHYNNNNNSNNNRHTSTFQHDGDAADDEFNLSSTLSSPLKILKHLAILCFAILVTMGAATTICILYIAIRPFSLPTYRRLSCTLGVAALMDAMSLLLPNMQLNLTGDSDPLTSVGVSVLVCNHSMDGDWWAMLMLARCVGLRGSIKAFLQRRATSSGTSGNKNGLSSSVHSHMHTSTYNNNESPSKTLNPSPSAPMLHCTSNNKTQDFFTNNSEGGMTRNLSIPNAAIVSAGGGGGGNGNGNGNATVESNTSTNANGGDGNKQRSRTNSNESTISSPPKRISSGGATPSTSPSVAQIFLQKCLDFPLLSSANNQNYVQDRDELFHLLRSFASNANGGNPVPTHLLLFPEGHGGFRTTPSVLEGQRQHDRCTDRPAMIAKSVEFAKREGRPQLKKLLLPRTTGFYASLDSLREASPVVYDVTMAYRGYNSQTSFPCDVSIHTLLRLIQGKIPNEVHIRVKRFSMEEVLSDPNWLDKQWAEKDRMLGHFERHGSFPVDNRGFPKYITMDTKTYSVESSMMALFRLGIIPFTIPIILFFAVPLLFCVGWIWLAHKSILMLFPGGFGDFKSDDIHGRSGGSRSKDGTGRNSAGGTDSAVGTPFFPATPFASPTHVASWTSAAPSNDSNSAKKRR